MLAANNEVKCITIIMKTKMRWVTMNELQTIHALHEFYHNLRFTRKKSKGKIIFFRFSLKIFTGFYSLPTDSHQYLHYDSCHAEYITRSITFSQTLQLTLICSQKSDLHSHLKELKNWLSNRGNPKKVILFYKISDNSILPSSNLIYIRLEPSLPSSCNLYCYQKQSVKVQHVV